MLTLSASLFSCSNNMEGRAKIAAVLASETYNNIVDKTTSIFGCPVRAATVTNKSVVSETLLPSFGQRIEFLNNLGSAGITAETEIIRDSSAFNPACNGSNYEGDIPLFDSKKVGTGNPYLPLWEHMPDGEPRVFEDPDNPGKYRIYVLGSHDTGLTTYCGVDVRMWSAAVEDLTQWRDEGPIFTYQVNGKWDIMYAPDMVEVKRKDGTKEYYLYPNNRTREREAMVCKSSRPDGPFIPVNMAEDGINLLPGSLFGFDPAVYVEYVTDPKDPDYSTGYRAYGYWGYQKSYAVQLDPKTMYSARPGMDVIPYFLPSSRKYADVRDPEGTEYLTLCEGENPADFNFFEASSIRKVGNKYVLIYSGYSGPDYGMPSSSSTLRYAYGDTPLGPWKSGGVLVDSRGIVPNKDGSKLEKTNGDHNTHGSLEIINGQWYLFYHRPPRDYRYARQSMVAPVLIKYDEKPVSQGGKVIIRGYDPYAPDEIWEAKASNGDIYTGAEVTSEGFQIYGLDPYKYYSAGYACYLSYGRGMCDSWDIWDNNMRVNMKNGSIVGFKYFGFGGLDEATKGLKPFVGAKAYEKTYFNIFLTPAAQKDFKISVWLDGPWDNDVWKGKKIGEINIPAGISREQVAKFTVDVTNAVKGLKKKHAIFLVAEGDAGERLCSFHGLGFSADENSMKFIAPPAVTIKVNDRELDLPEKPVRSNSENGYTGYNNYEVSTSFTSDAEVVVSSDNPEVKINTRKAGNGKTVVNCEYRGRVKIYTISFTK